MRLIDADALKRKCIETDTRGMMVGLSDIISAPTIKPKQGKWIGSNGYYQCSICGNVELYAEIYKFCPNCGAKMVNNTIDKPNDAIKKNK